MNSPLTITTRIVNGARDLTQTESNIIDQINNFTFSTIQQNFCYLISQNGIILVLETQHYKDRSIEISLLEIEEQIKTLEKKLLKQKTEIAKLEEYPIEKPLNSPIDSSQSIKDEINDLKGIKDSLLKQHPEAKRHSTRYYLVRLKTELLGYYTQQDKTIHLCMNTINNSDDLYHTYIHEMFHAYYDCDGKKSYEEVEEAIVEFSALCFIKEWEPTRLSKSLKSVESKKNYMVISFYGFGAYLFNEQRLNYIGIYKELKTHIQNTDQFKMAFSKGYPILKEDKTNVLLNGILYEACQAIDNQPLLLMFQLYIHSTLPGLNLRIIDSWWKITEYGTKQKLKSSNILHPNSTQKISENTLRAKRRTLLPCMEDFYNNTHECWSKYLGITDINTKVKEESCSFTVPFAKYVIQYMNESDLKSVKDLEQDLNNLHKPSRKKHLSFDERLRELTSFIKENNRLPRERSKDATESSLANWHRKNKLKIDARKLDTEIQSTPAGFYFFPT